MSLPAFKTVAVIGAGISGVVTAAHLKAAGLDVVVFERSAKAGGVWVYDEQKPLEPSYPSEKASVATNPPPCLPANNDPQDFRRKVRAPPGPCYLGLQNNVGTRLLQTTLNPFPPGTPDFVSHTVLREYVETTVRRTGVDEVTRYQTSVESVEKVGDTWTVSIVKEDPNAADEEIRETSPTHSDQHFDSVVVASGHYHAARVPNIPGLSEWKSRWPTRIQHSKGYRNPEHFTGKTVFLLGAGTSSTDIAKELGPVAKTIYQSSRGGAFDFPASFLPPNAKRVSGVASFDMAACAIPNAINLTSGQKVCSVDEVILCTGYLVSLPFLRQYHEDDTPATEANDRVLVTDGTQYHNLHKDIFYIPDPSLMFVGVPFFTATFSLFEFQAMTVAAFLSNKAELPSRDDMRAEYLAKVERRGSGKKFHSLRGEEEGYVSELLEWINKDAKVQGRKAIPGHTEAWKVAKAEQMERIQALFARETAIR
ncbi:FAD/NAD(P)-binding domain-containing protein [Saccharata proteae CBS 121410]|uniref:FAD/NAD(P)-binding domain-containing protein n=1 Tax=Saccharata proteae CBS 121410 TaxID=1314787 RepID=A0A9P4HQN4_9PEZI|nr:FAD/NAD(P)-binding domain-containing protein [Saccharata proteae CBS 121410]